MKKFLFASILASNLLLAGCVKLGDEETGLARTPAGDGPAVVWDLQARPLPEIPFPNDIATYPSNDSATGRRVNASMVGPTKFESKIRQQLDTLDGFGIYAPITVSFDEDIDPHVVADTMKGDDAFADDVLFLVNMNPDSPRYGQPVMLDLGNGNFPHVLEKTTFFMNDERAGQSNIVFETVNEDLNGNGVLDPGEDTNHDDVLGQANVLDPADDPQTELMTFYDRVTRTLWIRPLLPMDERSTYAVILTRRIQGMDGSPIRSPFEWVHDLRQTDALRPLVDDKILESLGVALDDVAFAWTFTTQSVTADLVEVRRGMEGAGAFADLAEKFPAELSSITALKDAATANGSVHVLDIEKLLALISEPQIFDQFFGGNAQTQQMFENGFQYVDYYVAGSLPSPYFIRDDGAWHVNSFTGEYEVGTEDVTFIAAIPKETQEFRAPFPVVVLMHGYTSNRLELLAWSASFCRYGVALVAIDGPGHGMDGVFSQTDVAGVSVLLEQAGILNARTIFETGRSKDLNGDGQKDSGGDMWTADFFHTRDMVRQFSVDISQTVRVLRSFDGAREWDFDLNGDGQPELAGDFNADGVVDLGGPDVTYGAAGGSLGGIMAGMVGAAEPRFDLVAAVSGAAGLTDVGIRSTQGGVNEAVTLRVFGPLLVTQPDGGAMTFHWQVPDVNDTIEVPVAAVPATVVPGDRIEVTNLENGETDWTIWPADGRIRLNFPADQGDAIRIIVRAPDGTERAVIDRFDREVNYQTKTWPSGHKLVSVTHGFGVKRQSKEYRRFMSIAEMVIEPGDPIGYARHYFLEPLPILPEGPHRVNFAFIPTIGDTAVPVASGLAMARAGGLLPVTAAEARSDVYRYGRGAPWDPALGFDGWYSTRLTWDEWRTQAGANWSPALLDLAPTPNDVYKANFVTEGIERLRRFESDPRFFDNREILFDVDDLADGADEWGQPRIVEPMRITRRTSAGMSFLRIPYMEPKGRHGFGIYEPERQFDMSAYMNSFLGQWFMTRGTQVIEAPCLETIDCEFLPKPMFDPNAIEVPASGQ